MSNTYNEASWSTYTNETVSSNYSNASTRSATDGQIKYYKDLCKQRDVKIKKKHAEWSFEKMSEKIAKLKAMKAVVGMTPKQSKTIEDVLTRCQAIDINSISPDWKKLDVQGASTLIGKLFELERSHRDKQPCTDAQIQKMLRMYLCPDVIFTDCGWVETYEVIDGKRTLIRPDSNVVGEWLHTNITSADANAFIQKYGVAYGVWAKTRISPEQKTYIRTMEARCANLHSAGKAHESTVDIDGKAIELNVAQRKEWCPMGYNALSDLEIFQLSKDDASKYIEMLQITLADREQVKFTQEENTGDRMEDKRTGTGDKAIENDIELMANFIHSIYAALGEELTQEAEQLAQAPTDAFSDVRFAKQLIEQTRELIAHAISVGVGFGAIDVMLDNVPNVRVAIGA